MKEYYKIFRGSPELIRKRLSYYIKYFKGCRYVLDLGCGRGEFLDLLKGAEITAIGVDDDPDAVRICSEAGYDIRKSDIFEFLNGNSGFDGIMVSHLIEHLNSRQAEDFIERCFEVLKPGGILVVITPNSENFTAITKTFWLDPTHVRPYPPEVLVELMKCAGFEIVDSGDSPVSRPDGIKSMLQRSFWGPILSLSGLGQVRYHLFSGHDVFSIGRKPGDRE